MEYINSIGINATFTLIVTIVIAIVNVIIRYFNKTLINKIGYDSESQAFKGITQSIFWASFANSSFVAVLANADLRTTPLFFLPMAASGFKDTTSNWYISMGPQIIQTA